MIVAIVPAAGLSSRMGRPKPLLDIEGEALVTRVVKALLAGGAGAVVVVSPPPDRPETAEIVQLVERAGGLVVMPSHPTIDMRATVELGLGRAEAFSPSAILLSPADTPGIRAELVRRVIEAGRLNPAAIVVPRSRSGRGHPIRLPWEAACVIRRLPVGSGVRALLDDPGRSVIEIDCDESLGDLDTPEDYRLWIEGRRS